jgi:hypothetical protein
VRTTQPWAHGETEIKIYLNEIGVTTIGTGAACPIDAMTVQDTMTEVQVIVMIGGGVTGMIEADIGETVGQGPAPQGGRDLETGIMEGGGGPRKE